jgi:hypothetical protein
VNEELWKAIEEYIKAEALFTGRAYTAPSPIWQQTEAKEARDEARGKVKYLLTQTTGEVSKTDRPEFITCIASVTRSMSICGKVRERHLMFINEKHAERTSKSGGKLVPCLSCMMKLEKEKLLNSLK